MNSKSDAIYAMIKDFKHVASPSMESACRCTSPNSISMPLPSPQISLA